MFYLNTVAAESESVQRQGIVRVGYFHQSYPRGGPDQELIRMSVQLIEAVPVRSVALYLVAGSSLWLQTIDLIVLLARPWLRVRTRIVTGTLVLGIINDSDPRTCRSLTHSARPFIYQGRTWKICIRCCVWAYQGHPFQPKRMEPLRPITFWYGSNNERQLRDNGTLWDSGESTPAGDIMTN
jgi:hypothetical protein